MTTGDSLADTFRALVTLLEKRKAPYLVIGGMAQAVIREPRLTQDLDCIVSVPTPRFTDLLEDLCEAGFDVDRQAALKHMESTGTFSAQRGRWRVDVITASTEFEESALEFEESAFRRAQRIRLYGVEANFPTPEDLILLKLVPGRDKDMLDVKTVIHRHRDRLDRSYLEQWARRLSDEAEDARMWHALQQIFKEADSLGTQR